MSARRPALSCAILLYSTRIMFLLQPRA